MNYKDDGGREQLALTGAEFRPEAFNVFNRVRFAPGSTQLQNQLFGLLTGSCRKINSPRQLQLALELYF